MSTQTIEIKVQRMHILSGDQSVKAFADITVNDAILIKGIMVVDGRNGFFVSMPREQAKDQKWYDTVRCLNKEILAQVTDTVLEEYKAKAM